ncbi:MAG TPA: hypothetical protein PLF40_01565, partial [Kofleriaceae bacterium]|nr:hypothetical protein [Kofleriaceae bacterium]
PPLPVDLGYNSVMKLGHLLLPGLLVGGATGCNLFFSASEDPSKDARLEQDSPNAVPMSHIARAFVRATPTAPFVTTTWQNLGSADVDITINRGQGFVPVKWPTADGFILEVDGSTPYRLRVVEHADLWNRAPQTTDYDSTEPMLELKVAAALGRADQINAASQVPVLVSGAPVPVTANVNNVYLASTGIWTFTLVTPVLNGAGYEAQPAQKWQTPDTQMEAGHLAPPLGLIETSKGDTLLLEKWATVPAGTNPNTPAMYRMEGFQAVQPVDMPTAPPPSFGTVFTDPMTIEPNCIIATYPAYKDAQKLAGTTPVQAVASERIFSAWSINATPAPEIGGDGGLALVNGYTEDLNAAQIAFGNPHKGHRPLLALASVRGYNDPEGVNNLLLFNDYRYYDLLPTSGTCIPRTVPPLPASVEEPIIGTTEVDAKAALTVRTISAGGAPSVRLHWTSAATPSLSVVDVFRRVNVDGIELVHRIVTRNSEVSLDVGWFAGGGKYIARITRLEGVNTGGDFRSINYPFGQNVRWTATFKINQ